MTRNQFSSQGPARTINRRRRVMPWALLLALGGAAGCGNYSNEDLEFMSAIPAREDLAVEIPRRANLTSAASAEGWRTTLQVTRTMNGVAHAFLSLIDNIRAHYPTGREGNTRVWGPFPAEDNPGWRVEFRMFKVEVAATQFDYELVMIPPAGVSLPMDVPETKIIVGTFNATGGARVGMGQLVVTLDEGRAAGLVFPGLDRLRTLIIDYQTRVWPRTVTMTIENLPPTAPANDPTQARYAYTREEDGAGTMMFSMVGDVVDLMNAVNETLQIESRWLARGRGRQDVEIVAGDGVGATTVECWSDSFESTFKTQNWATPPLISGDPASCIPRL